MQESRNNIPFAEVGEPDAIEKFICEPMAALKQKPLDKDASELLIMLCLSSGKFEPPQAEKPFLYQVIESRVEHCFTYKIPDKRAILFLSIFSERVGVIIMYLTYLQYWCKKNNVKEIDLDTLTMRVFPNGIYDEKDLHTIWQSQKVKNPSVGREVMSDNLIDYASALKSILF